MYSSPDALEDDDLLLSEERLFLRFTRLGLSIPTACSFRLRGGFAAFDGDFNVILMPSTLNDAMSGRYRVFKTFFKFSAEE